MGLSQPLLKELLQYDSVTGLLTWNHRDQTHFKSYRSFRVWNGKYAGKLALNTLRPDGYLCGFIQGKCYLTHRVIWIYLYGFDPVFIDHEDGNRSNNVLSNLEDVSHQANMKNRRLPSNNSSGHMGVYFVGSLNKWTSQIGVDGVTKHLGYFDSNQEAVTARKEAELQNNFHQNHGRT